MPCSEVCVPMPCHLSQPARATHNVVYHTSQKSLISTDTHLGYTVIFHRQKSHSIHEKYLVDVLITSPVDLGKPLTGQDQHLLASDLISLLDRTFDIHLHVSFYFYSRYCPQAVTQLFLGNMSIL